jgi:hypothetical protein
MTDERLYRYMTPADLPSRRNAMLKMRHEGMTLQQIADAQNPRISRQRVQQIIGCTGGWRYKKLTP